MTLAADHPTMTAKTDVKGRGAPLVLVPGGLTGWHSWEPHAERLARDRRVIRTQLLSVDLGLRGEPLPPGYSLRMESQALARALDDLEIQQADIVGWSYGGGIALDLALNDPGRVRSLTLVEPTAFWLLRRHGKFGPDMRAFQRAMQAYGPGEISEAQLERFLVEVGIVPAGVDARSVPGWPVWAEHRQSLHLGDAPMRHEDDTERLRRFDRPVLLFRGEGSTEHDRDIIDLLAQEFPNARVVELPGAHALPMVSMESFLAILSDFLIDPRKA